MTIRITPLIVAMSFMSLSLASLFITVPQSAEATPSAKAVCEQRVKKINNRGKNMAKKSKTIQANYKKANAGWKEKIKVNKQFAAKYSKEAQLQSQVNELNGKIADFKNGTKAYNGAKRTYIAERNKQVKSYKYFKANCATSAGRVAARDKMREWTKTDSKVLKAKATEVSDTYKSKVRTNIIGMRDARTKLISARKAIDGKVALATPSEVEAAVTPDDTDIDSEADNAFEDAEFLNEESNIEEPIPNLE